MATSEDLAKIRTAMGLDESIFTQYLLYLKGVLQLDLGTSYSFQAPALDVVLGRLPYTITLAFAAIVLTTVVAIPLGTWMARHADTRRELGANVVTIAGQSMPDFWTGLMLLTVFAVLIPVLPSAGFTQWSSPDPSCGDRGGTPDRADLPDGPTRDGQLVPVALYDSRPVPWRLATGTNLALRHA